MTNSIVPSIIKSYQGKSIRIREDKYVCLTDMASASKKKTNDWLRLKGTESLILALEANTGIPAVELVEVFEGGDGGTWAHPKLAIQFAQWCNPIFALQVSGWIDELMTTGSVSIAPQRQLAPQRDLKDYWDMAKEMGINRDPILLSLFSQRMAEQLGGKVLTATQQVIATVRAHELGYSAKEIGSGAALGTFVKKQGCPPTGKTKHGKYDVNVYDLTEDLDRAIHLYFS